MSKSFPCKLFRLKKRVHLDSHNSIFLSIFLNCFFAEILWLLRKSVPHYEKILLVFRTATLPCVSSSKTTTIYFSLLFDINHSARLRTQKKNWSVPHTSTKSTITLSKFRFSILELSSGYFSNGCGQSDAWWIQL